MFCRFLFIFTLLFASAFSKQDSDHIRILKLLPFIVQPPLVDPAIPKDFVLGNKEGDPYYTSGYYWGSEGSLSDYFKNPAELKGCLIRAQISNTVTQLGHNRFSCDGNTHDMTAAGFTEIKMSRGKWGIFPYRELLAKGPKGKWYYQMWVGLNTEEGATLYFQLIYPDYLNEPTQAHKNLWQNFVNKTSYLSLNDLVVIRESSLKNKKIPISTYLSAEKRVFDKKILVKISPYPDHLSYIEIVNVKETNFPFGKERNVEMDVLLTLKDGKTINETANIPYNLVDQFSFEKPMLSPLRFEERGNFLVFH